MVREYLKEYFHNFTFPQKHSFDPKMIVFIGVIWDASVVPSLESRKIYHKQGPLND